MSARLCEPDACYRRACVRSWSSSSRGRRLQEGRGRRKPAAAAAAGRGRRPATDGIRRVAIEADKEGYKPDQIPGKPGEKLVLVFTRTSRPTASRSSKTPDGKLVDLPMNKPVEVAVTVPQTGEVGFACGMDMFHGVVVADPKS